jgi:hypothetical protein
MDSEIVVTVKYHITEESKKNIRLALALARQRRDMIIAASVGITSIAWGIAACIWGF